MSSTIDNERIALIRPILPVLTAEWRWWLIGGLAVVWVANVLISGWSHAFSPDLAALYNYDGDSLFYWTMAKRVIEGWLFENPRSGYPFGSNFLDYPGSDSANHLALKGLGLLSGSATAAMNLYFLLSYFLVFVSTYCVCRAFHLRKPYALAVTILYVFLPFHFLRLGHLFFTWYFTAPLFFYLGLSIGRSVKGDEKTEQKSWPHRIAYVIALLVLASLGVYYALFGLIVIFSASLFGALYFSSLQPLKRGLAAIVLIVAGILANVAPNIHYTKTAGVNPEVAHRLPSESEVFGLKLVQFFLPQPQHRIPQLASLSDRYSKAFPLTNENMTSSLGVVGSLGFLAVLGTLVLSPYRNRFSLRLKMIVTITFILFLFGTIGGLGALFSMFLVSSIRSWNRVSIFIGFGALFTFAFLLQAAVDRWTPARWKTAAGVAICGLLVAFGMVDQTSATCEQCNVKTREKFDADARLVAAIESALPNNSAIYQLPYMEFPEIPPRHELDTYAPATGFTHSKNLRWSYGGMKGRDGDLFYRELAGLEMSKQLPILRNLGFAGIYVDRRGYPDQGRQIVAELTGLLGGGPFLKRDDDGIVFFRLPGAKAVDFGDMAPADILLRAGYDPSALGLSYKATLEEGIDFSRAMRPSFLSHISGMSSVEPWGRWSEANARNLVRIEFKQALPQEFTLVLTGRTFGHNAGKNLSIKVDRQRFQTLLPAGDFRLEIPIRLNSRFLKVIEFIPPEPISPRQFDGTDDDRKLAIGLERLQIKRIAPGETKPVGG
jgi:phosphoglycerol transferase